MIISRIRRSNGSYQKRKLSVFKGALKYISASPRDPWLRVGMALHDAFRGSAQGYQLWVNWSRTCPEKFDEMGCRRTWKSFKSEGITLGTLFEYARQNGWKDSTYQGGSPNFPINKKKQPSIVTNNRNLHEVSAEAWKALEAKNTPPKIFVRSAHLVRRVFDEHGRPVIERVSEAALRGALARSAIFLRKKSMKDKGGATKISPPIDIVQDIASLGQWSFPRLLGLTQCPVLRPDGTSLRESGYDPATCLLYDPAPGLSNLPIPDNPTEADARASARYIVTELFHDFPFETEADRANMVATLLTPIVRPAIIGGVPMALLDKNSPGAGASMLSDLVSIMATGEHAYKLSLPEGGNHAEPEIKKTITALLLDGSPVVVIDNVEQRLESRALQVLLTTTGWKDRILGLSQTVTLPNRVTLLATGNNIAVRGDMARRVYRVRLFVEEERPWTRTDFKNPDLLNWTRKHRGELLSHLLIMVRAWFVAGTPEPEIEGTKLGGYEEWTRLLSGILTFAGLPGFLANQDEVYADVDDEGPEWAIFLAVLSQRFGNEFFTTNAIASVVRPEGDAISEWIPSSIQWEFSNPHSSSKRLGKAFRKREGRIYEGFRLERAKKKHALTNTAQWRVVSVSRKANPAAN